MSEPSAFVEIFLGGQKFLVGQVDVLRQACATFFTGGPNAKFFDAAASIFVN